jgi:membrane-associated phospholipid phosphatase
MVTSWLSKRAVGDERPGWRSLARWLSIIFHPFVMMGLMVGTVAAARQTAGEAFRTVAIVAAFTILPLMLLMVRQVRLGAWDNVDASNRAERPVLYLVGAVGISALLVVVLILRTQPFLIRGVVATLAMVAVSAAATKWIKVSLHMAFATLAATTLALMRSPVGYGLLLVLPPLVWSRVTLGRHSPGEVAAGTVIGAAAGAAIHYL